MRRDASRRLNSPGIALCPRRRWQASPPPSLEMPVSLPVNAAHAQAARDRPDPSPGRAPLRQALVRPHRGILLGALEYMASVREGIRQNPVVSYLRISPSSTERTTHTRTHVP